MVVATFTVQLCVWSKVYDFIIGRRQFLYEIFVLVGVQERKLTILFSQIR